MLLQAVHTVILVAILWSFAPVVIGALELGHRGDGSKMLWSWVLITALLNVATAVLTIAGIKTVLFQQLTYPVYALVGGAALLMLSTGHLAKRIVLAGTALFLAWWMFWLVRGELESEFAVYNGPALALMFSVAGATLILSRLQTMPVRPFRDFGVLVGLGVLAINAPVVAIEPVAALLIRDHHDFTIGLYGLRAALSLVGSLLIALGFQWSTPSRTPHGSSLSVA